MVCLRELRVRRRGGGDFSVHTQSCLVFNECIQGVLRGVRN